MFFALIINSPACSSQTYANHSERANCGPSPIICYSVLVTRLQVTIARRVTCMGVGIPQVRELDLATLRWRRVDAKGTPPCFRIHSSAAVVGDKWIVHGGRRPGKFNVTNQTFVYSFTTNR